MTASASSCCCGWRWHLLCFFLLRFPVSSSSVVGEATGSTVVTVAVGHRLVSSVQVWGRPVLCDQTAGRQRQLQSQGCLRWSVAIGTPCWKTRMLGSKSFCEIKGRAPNCLHPLCPPPPGRRGFCVGEFAAKTGKRSADAHQVEGGLV